MSDTTTPATTAPRHSRKRRPILYVALACLTLAVIGLASVTHVYDAPMNAGIITGTDTCHIGFEWRGVPGPFVDCVIG